MLVLFSLANLPAFGLNAFTSLVFCFFFAFIYEQFYLLV